MSYILDALKKAERERRRGAVPDVTTVQDITAREREKRPLWPYLLAGALIVNAGLLVWWFAWPQAKTQTVRQATGASQFAAKVPDQAVPGPGTDNSGAPLDKSAQATGTVPKREAPAEGNDPSRSTVSVPLQPRQESVKAEVRKDEGVKVAPAVKPKEIPEASPTLQQQAPPAKSPQADSRPAAPAAPDKNRLYTLRELPVSVQQGLPDFTISTHLYAADAVSRLVRINGQLLKEGQNLSAGLVLEAITPDGVIFSYQGYRFRMGIK